MKEIQKTPFVSALLQQAVGQGVDISSLHVFEVRATSTVALRGKSGTVFEGAKISPNTISQLAQAVNNDPLPLMMDHNLNGAPYGKFFYAESHPMDNGDVELRGYLYVDDSDHQIIAKINASSIDEVSIQFLSEKLMCSECDFDYMQAAAEDNYMPFIDLTCDNGHRIGLNGVHTKIIGVVEAIELSLVSRGAAKNSKIIPPSDAKLQPQVQRLAAAGVELGNFYCTASASDSGETEVNFEQFMTRLDTANNEKQAAVLEAMQAKAQVTALQTQLDEVNAHLATLTAERDQLLAAQAKAAEPEFKEDEVATLKAYIGKQYVALKTLDGDTDAVAIDDVSAMLAYVDSNASKLTALIPIDGVSQLPSTNNDDALAMASMKAVADSFRSN